jgi:hypothetical protein
MAELSPEHSEGARGLALNFDLAQNAWPVLSLPNPPRALLRGAKAVRVDVFVPPGLPSGLSLSTTWEDGSKHETPPVPLTNGWNTVRSELVRPEKQVSLNAPQNIGWTLTSANHQLRGSVVFDRVQIEKGPSAQELIEGWERPLFWRSMDESVTAEIESQQVSEGRHAVKVDFDFAQCDRPMLLARLNPPWDLSGVKGLALDVFVPTGAPAGLAISLAFRFQEIEHSSRSTSLRSGWNHVEISLSSSWLPDRARLSAEQVQWSLSCPNQIAKDWVVFDNFRAQ